jgi:hypothetical protein
MTGEDGSLVVKASLSLPLQPHLTRLSCLGQVQVRLRLSVHAVLRKMAPQLADAGTCQPGLDHAEIRSAG